jgi:hypothetical protein
MKRILENNDEQQLPNKKILLSEHKICEMFKLVSFQDTKEQLMDLDEYEIEELSQEYNEEEIEELSEEEELEILSSEEDLEESSEKEDLEVLSEEEKDKHEDEEEYDNFENVIRNYILEKRKNKKI